MNAPSTREVVFVRNGTEGLNLVAYAWGLDNLGPGDVVVVDRARAPLELRAVAVHREANRRRVRRASRSTTSGELVLEALDEIEQRGRVKVVACALVSNTLGTINPVAELAAWAHERDAILVVDACQAAPHRPIDVQALGCDFLALHRATRCSGRAASAPSGVGRSCCSACRRSSSAAR